METDVPLCKFHDKPMQPIGAMWHCSISGCDYVLPILGRVMEHDEALKEIDKFKTRLAEAERLFERWLETEEDRDDLRKDTEAFMANSLK